MSVLLLQSWEIRIYSNNLIGTKLSGLYIVYFEEVIDADDNRPNVLCNTSMFYLFKRSSGAISRMVSKRFD